MSAFNPGRALAAGFFYFLLVFAAGFALGTIRTLALAPRIGEFAAVAIELPLMLAASWLACGAVLKRIELPLRAARLVMGVCAFLFLMAAEAALAHFAFARSFADYLETFLSPPGALGLAGQIAFAIIPLIRR